MSKKFNISDHISYRKTRYNSAGITNNDLLGLAVIEINPTELCNRMCSFCPRSNPSLYPNRNLNMDTNTAQILVEQLVKANYAGDIHITGFGEPTLNPFILDIIKIFADKFYTEMITNGDRLLNDFYSIQQFEDAGLDMIIVDCYDGESQVEKTKNILSTGKLNYRIRNHYDDGSADLLETYNFNNRGGLVAGSETLLRPCWLPFYKAFVDWNGDIGLCCNDWGRKQKSFGNIHTTSFDKIWMSEKFIRVRKFLNNGERKCLQACKDCNTSGTQAGFESVKLWQNIF